MKQKGVTDTTVQFGVFLFRDSRVEHDFAEQHVFQGCDGSRTVNRVVALEGFIEIWVRSLPIFLLCCVNDSWRNKQKDVPEHHVSHSLLIKFPAAERSKPTSEVCNLQLFGYSNGYLLAKRTWKWLFLIFITTTEKASFSIFSWLFFFSNVWIMLKEMHVNQICQLTDLD